MWLWVIFGFFCLLVAACLLCFYFWYLLWPVVSGRVLEVRRGKTPSNGVRGPRKYRLVVYRYTLDETTYESSRQGLILSGAAGPRVLKGDRLAISVCPHFQRLSCPRRPLFEGLVILLAAGLCSLTGLFILGLELSAGY